MKLTYPAFLLLAENRLLQLHLDFTDFFVLKVQIAYYCRIFSLKYNIFDFQLKSGYAEIFGTELVRGKAYSFKTGAKIAVFTWQGCTLELGGECDCYIAKETPMVSLVGLGLDFVTYVQ